MAALRSMIPGLQRLLFWLSVATALLAGLLWNAPARGALLVSVGGLLALRKILAIAETQKFGLVSRTAFLVVLCYLGYFVRPSTPLAVTDIPDYLRSQLVRVLISRLQELAIKVQDVRTEIPGLFSGDNLNAAYKQGNEAWQKSEQAIPLNQVMDGHPRPVILLRTTTNFDQALTDALHKISMSSLTVLNIEVVTAQARNSSIAEVGFSQTGLTEQQKDFGDLRNADYLYNVVVERAKLSPGFRIESTLQEAFSGTVRKQMRSYAATDAELYELLAHGPAAMMRVK